MAEESIYRPIFLLAALVLLLTSSATTAPLPYQPGMGFPVIQIGISESARVTALNLEEGSSTKDSSCSVTLQFVDIRDRVVKQTIVLLRSGEAGSLEVSRAELPGNDPRAEIRAVLLFGYYGGAPPGPAIAKKFHCNIVPSLQVFDASTGEIKLVFTDAKPLPPPTTPAQ